MPIESVGNATNLLSATYLNLMDDGSVFASAPKVLITCMPKSGSTWLTTRTDRFRGSSCEFMARDLRPEVPHDEPWY
jgi:hypothetical protein